MPEPSKKRKIHYLLRQFEEALSHQSPKYFDIDDLEMLYNHFLDLGRYQKSLKVCDLGLDLHPSAIELLSLKSQALVNLSRYTEALQNVEKAIQLQPNDVDRLTMKAHILSIDGQYDQAVSTLENALKYCEFPDEVHYQIGLAHQQAGAYKLAVKAYKQSVEHNLEHEGALYELAYGLI